MTGKTSYFCSTIGRKQLVALTGLGLSLFVLIHMAGNLLIFVGPQAYNEYSHNLVSNPLIFVAEAGLLGMFLLHFSIALKLAAQNFKARPQSYAVQASGAKATSAVTKSMWAQGLVILVFAILHLITFKFGQQYTANYGKGDIRDLHRLVIEVFHNPTYVGGYVVALLILGAHLSHGLQSTMQTLGINHPKYQCGIKGIGYLYSAIVSLGFISQPIYVFFFYRG